MEVGGRQPSNVFCVFLVVVVLSVTANSRVFDRPSASEHQHYDDSKEHNVKYDHDAFLGHEEAEEFEQLSPEESIKRLEQIYGKIDKDPADGKISQSELTDWIKYVQDSYIRNDIDRQWKSQNVDKNDQVSWDDYKASVYGFLNVADADAKENEHTPKELESYQKMISRDQRRWNRADEDGDGKLTKEQFSSIMHPEEYDSMKDIVVQETLDDIDKDGDGRISVDEYIADMWPEGLQELAEPEPSWVRTEREHFERHRDANKDGYLDFDEIRTWVLPAGYDQSEAESQHLIFEADENKDGFLTKEEMINKHDLFVGSQATDYGEALLRHEEL